MSNNTQNTEVKKEEKGVDGLGVFLAMVKIGVGLWLVVTFI